MDNHGFHFWTTTYTMTPPPPEVMAESSPADKVIQLTITEPVGEPVVEMISGHDVIHGFMVSVMEGYFDPATASEFLNELASGHPIEMKVSVPI